MELITALGISSFGLIASSVNLTVVSKPVYANIAINEPKIIPFQLFGREKKVSDLILGNPPKIIAINAAISIIRITDDNRNKFEE